MTKKIKESAEYENCLDILGKEATRGTLTAFVDDNAVNEKEDDSWEKHWTGMPAFENETNAPFMKINISFKTEEDYTAFAKLIEQNLTTKTKSIWYPALERGKNFLKRWIEEGGDETEGP